MIQNKQQGTTRVVLLMQPTWSSVYNDQLVTFLRENNVPVVGIEEEAQENEFGRFGYNSNLYNIYNSSKKFGIQNIKEAAGGLLKKALPILIIIAIVIVVAVFAMGLPQK